MLCAALAASCNFRQGVLLSSPASATGVVQPLEQRLAGGRPFRQQSGHLSLVALEGSVNAWWLDSAGRSSYPAIVENQCGFWMTRVF